MGWNQYVANKPVLIGIHHLELRLLAKMGYEVLVVSRQQIVATFCLPTDVITNFS